MTLPHTPPADPPVDPPKPDDVPKPPANPPSSDPEPKTDDVKATVSQLSDTMNSVVASMAAIVERLDTLAPKPDSTPTPVPWTHRGGR